MTMLRTKFPSSLALTMIVVLATSTNALATFFEESYAIVIGIDRYANEDKWHPLSYATKDANGMAEFLREQKFKVTTLLNEDATRANILNTFRELASKLQEEDRVLLFFSGHGETEKLGGQDFGYIIPHDGGMDSSGNWISMAVMREQSRKLGKARHQLFIFDSCYGGQFAVPRKGPLSAISESHPRYVEKISTNPARQYITAGGESELVLASGPNGYSYFTGFLLEALQGHADLDGDTYITSSELDAYLQPRASNYDHTPIAGTMPEHGQGNFWFRAPETPEIIEPLDTTGSTALSISYETKGHHPEQAATPPTQKFLLTEIPGVGKTTAKKLMEKELETVEKIAALSDDDILKYAAVIRGLGPKKLRQLRQSAQELLD